MNKPVWTFTNQISLGKSEFIAYLEKKVFKTIRQHGLLPKDKIFKIEKSNSIQANVLKYIIGKKFSVVDSKEPNTSENNLTIIAEKIFENILKGNYIGPKPKDTLNYPLYFVSDKELGVYSKLQGIKGTKRKQNTKIDSLFKKFTHKNPDLELNIVKALRQVQEANNNET